MEGKFRSKGAIPKLVKAISVANSKELHDVAERINGRKLFTEVAEIS